ncbi:hypothetical protein [Cryptosporangium phraense]|uniref:Ricin-type beta-trefoil lectin domain protein n=1 Tax=Cryptosporangium phraense TaxID=2593070 RepID=A0A545AQN4_9ACTN|nr:hypothetical protein [Cryptosporangium phraense]TQS43015.1 hypothetical protein FL583_21510 [Cryptosporangium phraense]
MLRALTTAAAALATAVVAVPAAAQAATAPPAPLPTPSISLQNVATGECLGLVQVGRRARIGLGPCTFGPDQLWQESAPLSTTRSWLVLRSTGGCLDLDVSPNLAFGTDQCGTITFGGQQVPDPSLYWTRADQGNGTVQLVGNGNHGLGFTNGAWFAADPGTSPAPETTWAVITEGAA